MSKVHFSFYFAPLSSSAIEPAVGLYAGGLFWEDFVAAVIILEVYKASHYEFGGGDRRRTQPPSIIRWVTPSLHSNDLL